MPDNLQSTPDAAAARAVSVANTFFRRSFISEVGKRPKTRCSLCSRAILSEFFRVNGKKVCETCADNLQSGLSTPSHSSLIGALFFGFAGASRACVLYSAVTFATGWTFGYFALVVGWIVGKAVMTGARAVGGFRIQLVAASFTYAAITLNALPRFLYAAYSEPENLLNSPANWLALLGKVVITGLATPFRRYETDPFSVVVGLLIIFLAIAIAWQLTRLKTLVVGGPFSIQ